GQRLGGVRRVHRDGDATAGQDREVRPDPLRAGLRQDADGVAGLAAEGNEPERDLTDLVSELAPGDVLPAACCLDALGGTPPTLGYLRPEQRSEGFSAHGWW